MLHTAALDLLWRGNFWGSKNLSVGTLFKREPLVKALFKRDLLPWV